MFKRLLVKYKLHKSVYNIFIFFCLIILSGCGNGKSAEIVSSPDNGEMIAGDNGESTPVDVITLSWLPPTSNADGSTLTDLGGYMIYYGEEGADVQAFSMDVGNVTSATFDNLSPGTWCFTVTAYDSAGIESNSSNYACKEV